MRNEELTTEEINQAVMGRCGRESVVEILQDLCRVSRCEEIKMEGGAESQVRLQINMEMKLPSDIIIIQRRTEHSPGILITDCNPPAATPTPSPRRNENPLLYARAVHKETAAAQVFITTNTGSYLLCC